MNKDIYYILLKSQNEIIEKMENEIYDLKAKLYMIEFTHVDLIPCNRSYHSIHCESIENLVKNKGDTKLILKLLQLMYIEHKHNVVNEHEYNPNIVALCHQNDVAKFDRKSKKLIRTLYHYLGKEFASHEEIDKIFSK